MMFQRSASALQCVFGVCCCYEFPTHTHPFDFHFLIKFSCIRVQTEINDSENTSLVKVDMCAIHSINKKAHGPPTLPSLQSPIPDACLAYICTTNCGVHIIEWFVALGAHHQLPLERERKRESWAGKNTSILTCSMQNWRRRRHHL